MGFRYANIIVNITNGQLDKTFQYRIPEALKEDIKTGMQVEIPFGAGNRLISGYIIELTDKREYEEEKIKEISRILDRGVAIETRLIALAAWMKERYGATMIQALKTVLPVKEKIKGREEKTYYLTAEDKKIRVIREELNRKHQRARLRFLDALIEKNILTGQDLKTLKVSGDVADFFLENGMAALSKRGENR